MLRRLRTGKDGHCCIGVEHPRLSDEEAVWGFAKDHERLNLEQTVRFETLRMVRNEERHEDTREEHEDSEHFDATGSTHREMGSSFVQRFEAFDDTTDHP